MPMFQRVDFTPEAYNGRSQPVYPVRNEYRRMRADEFRDKPASLTERQANFYRNLIHLALATDSSHLPVDFETADGARMCLDRGCIKIAEHAGFIRSLEDNDERGTVGSITLSWTAFLGE